jgi:hypothetical protein
MPNSTSFAFEVPVRPSGSSYFVPEADILRDNTQKGKATGMSREDSCYYLVSSVIKASSGALMLIISLSPEALAFLDVVAFSVFGSRYRWAIPRIDPSPPRENA